MLTWSPSFGEGTVSAGSAHWSRSTCLTALMKGGWRPRGQGQDTILTDTAPGCTLFNYTPLLTFPWSFKLPAHQWINQLNNTTTTRSYGPTCEHYSIGDQESNTQIFGEVLSFQVETIIFPYRCELLLRMGSYTVLIDFQNFTSSLISVSTLAAVKLLLRRCFSLTWGGELWSSFLAPFYGPRPPGLEVLITEATSFVHWLLSTDKDAQARQTLTPETDRQEWLRTSLRSHYSKMSPAGCPCAFSPPEVGMPIVFQIK